MVTIYAKASEVVIWLGTCDDTSMLIAISGLVYRSKSNILTKTLLNDSEPALVRILQRDWFYRIWTKQVGDWMF